MKVLATGARLRETTIVPGDPSGAYDDAGHAMATANPAGERPGEGEWIGTWRLVRRIGEGAFGAVYEAERGPGGQRAAVKVLHPHIAAHPDIQRRFINEARAAARAEHGNIVRIFDSGIDAGTCFVAMELLAGSTLRAVLGASGPLSLFRTLELGAQVAAQH